MELVTTLNKIRACSPCSDGWAKLLLSLGKTGADDKPLPFRVILENNGLDDALWCCRSAPEYDKEWRLFIVWCVRQVQHLLIDPRSIEALDIAEHYAYGNATDTELTAAGDAIGHAAWTAAWDAAGAAARAAAWAVVLDAAGDAVRSAARAAARAAAGDEVRAVAWTAAWDAAREAQKVEFLRVLSGIGDKLCTQ